jgi:hypothetical protein
MASPSQDFQNRNAYFHSVGRTNTSHTQNTYESPYKSAHTVRASEIWAEDIPYAATATEADAAAFALPNVIVKYEKVPLKEVPGSNGQAWYLDVDGKFVKPWIAPTDVPHPTTNMPATGYQARIFRENGTSIPLTDGVYIIDYYSGMVRFQEGYTPKDMGYGTPSITCYAYIGKMLADVLEDGMGGKDESYRVDMLMINETDDGTYATFFYEDHPLLDHFILERFDEETQTWVPYDNESGIVAK